MNRLFLIGVILCSTVIIYSCETEYNTPRTDSTSFLKLYGGSGDDFGVDMINVNNSYFLLGNVVNQAGISKIYLVKTDELGNEIWKKSYGSNLGSDAKSLDIDLNGNLIISSTVVADNGNKDVMFLRLDQEGVKIDSAVYGSRNYDEVAGEVIAASDGSYLMIGTTWEMDPVEDDANRINKIQILRTYPNSLDTLTEQLWNKYSGQGTQDFGVGIKERNNVFYGYGYSNSENVTGQGNIGGFNLLLYRINQTGEESSPRFFGSQNNQTATKLIDDGQGFLLLGNSDNGGISAVIIARASYELAPQPSFEIVTTKSIESTAILDIGLSYLILGTDIISPADRNIILMNIDKSGSVIWQTGFGSEQTLDKAGFGLLRNSLGEISLIGTIDLENQNKICLIKVNDKGELKP